MIVVTGGAGFIGSNLVRGLAARGERDVAVVDRLGDGDKWRNIAKRELAAIVPPEQMTGFLDANAAEISAVFHLGAISSTAATDADAVVAANLSLSQQLWDWCAWRGARLLYASSAATYGDGAAGFDDDGSTEALARLRPLNLYGWSKHAFDRRVARLVADGRAAPPQWAGLKFFNVYGPNEYHKAGQASVVPRLYQLIRAGQPPVLFKSHRDDIADGAQMRDFVAVEDCVAALLFLLDRPEISGLFNCGSGRARCFRDVAAAIGAAAGAADAVEYVETPPALRRHYQYYTQAEMGRLRAHGFTRSTPLEDGVARYVRDYLATDDPYA